MRLVPGWAVVWALMIFTPAVRAQDPKAKAQGPKVDEAKVEIAIRKGIAYLRTKVAALAPEDGNRPHELVLWTFVRAGLREGDPDFQTLFKRMMESELERTYNVALQAMILEEIDRVKYQPRIWQCAQFLVDNQSKPGDWAYGDPTTINAKDVPTVTPTKKGAPSAKGAKPPPVRKVPVKKQRDGLKPWGDNSNSQYAALGLRACHDAGILIPAEVIEAAIARWRQAHLKDKGWNYRGQPEPESYGSMTAGAIGSLAIYLYMLNKPWMTDKDLTAGMEWLAENFTVTENPKKKDSPPHYYYFLYALERLGALSLVDKIGSHEWYPEGANVILESQQADGSWKHKDRNDLRDTCFAILFLRRATRPLVESVDRFHKKP